jgi:hypothetical protein
MANKIRKVKQGMGGNRHGGRSEKTEILKSQSKKLRRLEGALEVANSLSPESIGPFEKKSKVNNVVE